MPNDNVPTAPSDAIARSKRILALVDEYHENPTRATRTTLRVALMDEFQPEPRVEVTEEQPSLTNPLAPYGMLVRALRIVSGTTLMDMAYSLLTTPAKLSAMEFGRAPVAPEFAFDVAAYFDALGVPDTLVAIRRSIDDDRA